MGDTDRRGFLFGVAAAAGTLGYMYADYRQAAARWDGPVDAVPGHPHPDRGTTVVYRSFRAWPDGTGQIWVEFRVENTGYETQDFTPVIEAFDASENILRGRYEGPTRPIDPDDTYTRTFSVFETDREMTIEVYPVLVTDVRNRLHEHSVTVHAQGVES